MIRLPVARLGALVLAGAVAAPALAQSHAAHGGAGSAPSAAAPSPRPAAFRAPAGSNVVDVVARDYAFDVPTRIPAGLTTFRLRNEGPDLHHIYLVKLAPGKTMADVFTYMQQPSDAPSFPSWATPVGGPNTPRPGGGESNATLYLEAGEYAMLCVIPAKDGMPHVMKGMAKAITVTPAARPSRPASGHPDTPAPKADVTMTLRDYDFAFSAPLTAGRQTVRIVNAAEQFHEAFIARLLPGKTAAEALKWVETGMQGPPPMELVGGTTGLAQGRGMQFTADFTPGEYALLCFLPDKKDGKPHVAHGMMKQITVAKKTQSASRATR